MKNILFQTAIFLITSLFVWHCSDQKKETPIQKVRDVVDTVGFAHTKTQMEAVVKRINQYYGNQRENIFQINDIDSNTVWKMVICPHDDYSYAGEVYPYVLKNLSASTVIIFGVAHKAKRFGIEDKLVFDSFTHWEAPYRKVKVSSIRDEILTQLPPEMYVVNDSLQQIEHSVEALLPFLQYYHRPLEIVSILVPYMRYSRMMEIAKSLTDALQTVTQKYQWKWGKDFAFAISNDCVHYGDQDWGGKNYAPFGADSAGYRAATNYDMKIISECLIDQLDPQRIRRFVEYTVKSDNYKEYAWTWCGRYSVPFGTLTAYYLQQKLNKRPLNGTMLRYSTSVANEPIEVSDLGMGVTAPANIHHWVGYVAIGY